MKNFIFLLVFILSFGFISQIHANEKTKCELNFDLSSWSVFYKSGKGSGKIFCDNGQEADVAIRAHGGGITFGKSKIVNGHGNFSKVKDIRQLMGSYATSEAHAGIKGSVGAEATTKGKVSLAMSGRGRGYNLGIAFGKFKIAALKIHEPLAPDEDSKEDKPSKVTE